MSARLGILGGMGPQATNTFYQLVLERTAASCDQEHIHTLILSDTGMPDRTAAILSGETEPVFQRLLQDAKQLADGGCQVLAVPCNTAHFFLDRVAQQVDIPIVHMIRETAKALLAQGKGRPGILATDGTIQTGLYQKELAVFGIEAVVPSPKAQQQVMSLIYDDIKAGRPGEGAKFQAAHQDLLDQGCDCGVLACTELSVYAMQTPLPPFYVDALAVLAQGAVLACGKSLRV